MDDEIKALCREIATGIRRKVLREKSNNFSSWDKKMGIGADGTPTEYIDRVAEDVAIKYIKKSGIAVNILSEETGYIDSGGEYTLIIDPIDGTRNAVRGIPFYATSIAVGRDKLSDIEYGVVMNIPSGDMYIAEKGEGAYLNNHRIFAPQHTSGKLLSSLVLGESGDKRVNNLPHIDNVRSLGAASLEMSLVAHGAIDCFVCLHSHLRITDIAASTLIVREADGIVCDGYGKELDMPCDILEHTSVITCANEEVLSRIIGYIG